MTARQRLLESLAETARQRADKYPDVRAGFLVGRPSEVGGAYPVVPGLMDHVPAEDLGSLVSTYYLADDLAFILVGSAEGRDAYIRLARRACGIDQRDGFDPLASLDEHRAGIDLALRIVVETGEALAAGLDASLRIDPVERSYWLPTTPERARAFLPFLATFEARGHDVGGRFSVVIDRCAFEAIEARLFSIMAEEEGQGASPDLASNTLPVAESPAADTAEPIQDRPAAERTASKGRGLDRGSLAVAAALELSKEGLPVSLRAACKRAGVDRGNVAKNFPKSVAAIEAIGSKVVNVRRGQIDRRSGNLDGVDDADE